MTEAGKSNILDYAGKILLLALFSYTFGKLGLLLAISPGYASVLWPPAGIGLGMLLVYGEGLWPGIFISSFLLNSGVADEMLTGEVMSAAKLWAAAGIAAASSLQAFASVKLVRRHFNVPQALGQPRDVAKILLLGGPIGCLIAASIGVAMLYAAGIVPPADFMPNWAAWWLGDVAGVIIFTPLFLIFSGTLPRLFLQTQSKGMFLLVVLASLAIPSGVTVAAWQHVVKNARERAQARFEHLALESERALTYRMDSYEQSLLSGVGLLSGSGHVRRVEWRQFAETIGIRDYFIGVNGIGFIAAVPAEQLEKFLQDTRTDEAPGFAVHPEPVAGQDLFIIKYIEPEAINASAVGLNIASDESSYKAALAARDTGKAVITSRIMQSQDAKNGPGFLLMLPVYKGGKVPPSQDARRADLAGWVYAPFIGRNFMEGLTVSQGTDFTVEVYDDDEEKIGNLIYASGQARDHAGFTVRKEIDIKQQKWLLVWKSTAAFEKGATTNEATIVLLAGLLFTSLLGVLLITQAQRTEVIERMVESRTAELTEREAHLAQVVDKLTESNVELERFAYVVSHDMQEPVRMVANFSSLLWHQYQGKMDPAGQKYLGIITDGAKRLQAMIADLLEYARIGQGARGREKVDVRVLLQYVLENLNFVIYEHEAQITHGEMPVFLGYPVQIMSLFQNLINNAIKYQAKGAVPVVHIEAQDRGDNILFSVRDNGIGIDPDSLEKIFEPFKRLHTYQDYSGTGLGLSVCKKIVDNHGGKIWVESIPGQGSVFFFTVMK